MVTCQSSKLGWEVTVELSTDFLSLGRGSVTWHVNIHVEMCMFYLNVCECVNMALHVHLGGE